MICMFDVDGRMVFNSFDVFSGVMVNLGCMPFIDVVDVVLLVDGVSRVVNVVVLCDGVELLHGVFDSGVVGSLFNGSVDYGADLLRCWLVGLVFVRNVIVRV